MKFKDLDKSLKISFYWIGLFFFLLVSSTVYTFHYAKSIFEPVMDKDYYEKGLNYEKLIKAQEVLEKEGFTLESDLLKVSNWDSQKTNTIFLELKKKGTVFQEQYLPTIVLERGASKLFSKEIQLKKTNQNTFTGSLAGLEPGEWTVILKAEWNGNSFRKITNITVR